jgi:3-deoxy-D-arabino-heptulosonate 7-phosphate (DAHP) synthase class II
MLFRGLRAERESNETVKISCMSVDRREKIFYKMAICLLYIGRYPAVKVGCVYIGGL